MITQRLARPVLRAAWAALLAVVVVACGGAPAAPATTPLPYRDDFSDPNSGWQTLSDVSADVRYDAGRLRFVIKQENLTQWSVPGKAFDNGALEVDAQPAGGPTDNGFGVLFRFKDRKNFYHFEISSDGYWRAGLMKDGVWENWEDWATHPAIKTGTESNRIKVVMQDDQFTFLVNGQQIAQKQDASFSSGDIGLLALTLIDAPGTDVVFDNLSMVALTK
jgi:hypothetical protein